MLLRPSDVDPGLDQAFRDGIRPPPIEPVWQWADKNRVLSDKVSKESGPWRTSRTPYLREIMEVCSPSDPIQRIAVKKGTQLGFTECGNNFVGYVIDRWPGPIMMLVPTLALARKNSTLRIAPMIAESPALRKKVRPPRSRDSGNTQLTKEFDGGVLVIVGANSATDLSSTPMKVLFADEVDRMPFDLDDEGDPLSVAERRLTSYGRRHKIFLPSSPTVKGKSKIDREYERGDKRKYHLPCPHCGHMQELIFSQLKWEAGNPETAMYQCIADDCGKMIAETQKQIWYDHDQGVWIATAEGDGVTASFHINSLYSPYGWESWESIAREWEGCQGKPNELKVFVNTILAETWEERGEAPDHEKLYDRRLAYPSGVCPAGVLFLTVGTDTQDDRLEATVYGWGLGKQCWLIKHYVFHGDPHQPKIWKEMDALLDTSFKHETGPDLRISKLCIDAMGHMTQQVYAWAYRKDPSIVGAIQGSPVPFFIGNTTRVDVKIGGRHHRKSLPLHKVGSALLRGELYSRLRLKSPAVEEGEMHPDGFIHFNAVADQERLRQLTAWRISTVTTRKGESRREWVKARERDEFHSCWLYARAGASWHGMDSWTEEAWADLANSVQELGETAEERRQRAIEEMVKNMP